LALQKRYLFVGKQGIVVHPVFVPLVPFGGKVKPFFSETLLMKHERGAESILERLLIAFND
jgi:hypothetical protein